MDRICLLGEDGVAYIVPEDGDPEDLATFGGEGQLPLLVEPLPARGVLHPHAGGRHGRAALQDGPIRCLYPGRPLGIEYFRVRLADDIGLAQAEGPLELEIAAEVPPVPSLEDDRAIDGAEHCAQYRRLTEGCRLDGDPSRHVADHDDEPSTVRSVRPNLEMHSQGLRVVREKRRLPRQDHPAIDLDPPLLDLGNDFSHSLPADVVYPQPRYPLVGGVRVEEAIVDGSSIPVEEHFVEGEADRHVVENTPVIQPIGGGVVRHSSFHGYDKTSARPPPMQSILPPRPKGKA